MKIIFQDPTFFPQLLRTISKTYYKGANIGECLSTAYSIKESDLRIGIKNDQVLHKEFISMQRPVLPQDIK